MRIGLLVVAGLALIGFLVVAVVMPHMEGANLREAAQALVAGEIQTLRNQMLQQFQMYGRGGDVLLSGHHGEIAKWRKVVKAANIKVQ